MIIDINYLCEEIHKAIRKHQILTEGRQSKNRNAAKNYIMQQLGYSESDAMQFIGQLKVKIPSVRLQQEKFLLGVARLFIDGDLSVNDDFKCTNFNQTLKLIASDAHVNEYDNDHWNEMIQMGYLPKSPWYVNMCHGFNNNAQRIAQELDVSFLGSDSNVVDPKYIAMQLNLNVREPDTELKDPVLPETWVWKPPYEGHRYIMGIDNSRGDSDDATALEIIDLDGVDDDGKPCIEQVLEYSGKLTESIDASSMKVTKDGLPGFHSSSVRFQMLSNFANLVKTNQFKIRSQRVINELDTWIFKNGRMDHKDGCHDDTLTCLAMTLFVVTYSINKQIEAKEKDTAMLRAMISINSRIQRQVPQNEDKPKHLGILLANDRQTNAKANMYKSYMWLFN